MCKRKKGWSDREAAIRRKLALVKRVSSASTYCTDAPSDRNNSRVVTSELNRFISYYANKLVSNTYVLILVLSLKGMASTRFLD